jgi:hypothetical protein
VKRAAYFAAAMALTAVLVAPAWARVGVTSVTDGTTSAVQGTELQAGQHITTGPNGRVHLMFVDGSAVTVGPNTTLRIDSYSYDPASKTGAMTLDVQRGTIRFVGGAISKKADVQIRTPSSTIGIRGGIAAVSVNNGGATTANFLHGSAMHVSGQGMTQTATRSGSQINVPAGGQPGLPAVLAAGQLTEIQSLDRAPSTAQGRPAGHTTAPTVDSAFAKSDLGRHTPSATQPRSPALPPTIAQAPTQAVQTSQQQLGQQQFLGLLAAKLATPPAAVPAPLPMAASVPAPPSPTPAAPVVPAAKPAPAGGGTMISAGAFGMSSGATITMMGGSCCGAIFVSGSMSGSGSLTKSGTGGSTIITGTK